MKPSQEKPRRRVKSSLVGASEAFDELVHQFTDPLAFLRELIQNSLDAASTRIARFAFLGCAQAPEHRLVARWLASGEQNGRSRHRSCPRHLPLLTVQSAGILARHVSQVSVGRNGRTPVRRFT